MPGRKILPGNRGRGLLVARILVARILAGAGGCCLAGTDGLRLLGLLRLGLSLLGSCALGLC